MLGEFPVVMNLIKDVPEAQEAKHQVDRLIEAIGPPQGVEHIREAIVMDKMQYDVASDEYRDYLKERIMDQVEKYFMLIIFSLYCKQVGDKRKMTFFDFSLVLFFMFSSILY